MKKTTYNERQQKRDDAQKHEDIVMVRCLLALAAVIVGVAAVLFIRDNGINTMNFYLYVKFPLEVLTALMTLGSAGYIFSCIQKRTDESNRFVTGAGLAVFSLTALLMTCSYGIVGLEYDAVRIVALIVLLVLYFIFNVYDRLFFTVSAQCAFAIFALYMLSKIGSSGMIRASVAAVIVAASILGAYTALRVFASKHEVSAKDKKFLIMSAVIAAAAIVSLVVPGAAMYAIFAVLAVYVVIAVISTIEMM